MADLRLSEDLVDEIAARLDLREPNRAAVQSLAAEVSRYYDLEEREAPFECVIVSATGVGKTFVLTGALELFLAAREVHDFVIIAPGRTILEKTRDNFTPGHPKSLLGPLSFTPTVITAENFASPATRAAIEDPTAVKIYLFTVQALLRPETNKTARRTRKFQESLGKDFYEYLQGIENLVVLADEHHTYYGPAFSDAVRSLDPWVLVGLTATPHKSTPEDQIIFRYPLAAAIADKLVKTPVLVGRRDDRADPLTKLTDGVVLLKAKEEALRSYSEATAAELVKPVMLVVAKDIADSEEYGAILASGEFFEGAFADAVLVIHSKSADDALAKLAAVEEPASSVRIIISVGMLKEGWDVRNVYVIASMRSNFSDILTEQTLGRGMRLPFGKYTDIQLLDTLEVVAHEKYEELLKKRGVLNESFIDYRTRVVLGQNSNGETVVVKETVETDGGGVVVIGGEAGANLEESDDSAVGAVGATPATGIGVVDGRAATVLTSVEQRTRQAIGGALKLKKEIERRRDAPKIVLPALRMNRVTSKFSLSDISSGDDFRRLGEKLATDPENELQRFLVSARIETGADGIKRTTLIRTRAADQIKTQPKLFTAEELRAQLSGIVLNSAPVPARAQEHRALEPILDAFFEGLGERVEPVLSAYLERAAARLVELITKEQRSFLGKPEFDEVIETRDFEPTRATDRQTSDDRFGPFQKSLAYEDWERSLFPLEWFDSEPERRIANMVDGDPSVAAWVRLHTGELPILWASSGQEYNPDFIVIDQDRAHWIVEAKMDKEMSSEDVKGKRDAARRWTKHASSSERVDAPWRYLLVSETDIDHSKGSWAALKKLGGA